VEQDWHNFKVLIDGALCFETSSVRIPSDYYFGITAQSSELPDSIEINKLVITTDTAEPGYPYPMDGSGTADPLHNNAHHAAAKDAGEQDSIDRLVQQKMHQNHGAPDYLKQDTPGDDLPDLPASAIDSDRQFADLHYRLQALSHVITTLSAGVFSARDLSDAHHTDLSTSIIELKHTLGALGERLSTLEVSVHDLRRDSAEGIGSLKTVIEDLRREVIHSHSSVLMGVRAHQDGVLEGFKEHMPGHGRFVLWVLLVQVSVGGAYLAYKRRRKTKGNKYL
jgi:mannose-binding lectin 1